MRKTLCILALAVAGSHSAHAYAQADFGNPTAARAVVEAYYKAIDEGNYRTAYYLWRGNGKASGKTYSGFRRGFSETARTRVLTREPVNSSGAMGSIYIDVPVDVFATLKNGRRQHFGGKYTLVRVNDVDGANEEQLRWHLASATLRAQP
ncbi:hypothetical protein [Massilia phyllosphaerae]|uniref:hypothetical protein n=1 Tax=Massilia phyllosphaerae TaxID=3106034 RepID=UPI002B1CCCED|nr:hypothetical protein [Massilia sp. SGZ-792]